MHRLIVIAACLAAPVAAAPVAEPATPPKVCAPQRPTFASGQPGHDGFHRLDRLPPAALYLAVLRTVDRCPAPLIVRDDIGPARPRR